MTKRNVVCLFSLRGEKIQINASANPNRAAKESFYHLLQNDYGADGVQVFDRISGVEYATIRRTMKGKVVTDYEYDPEDFKPMRLSSAGLFEAEKKKPKKRSDK